MMIIYAILIIIIIIIISPGRKNFKRGSFIGIELKFQITKKIKQAQFDYYLLAINNYLIKYKKKFGQRFKRSLAKVSKKRD